MTNYIFTKDGKASIKRAMVVLGIPKVARRAIWGMFGTKETDAAVTFMINKQLVVLHESDVRDTVVVMPSQFVNVMLNVAEGLSA